jgi:L-alanine-DL-glutamate epimerase-like enolase superfamily enzyme
MVEIDRVDVHAFTVPTDGPDGREQDGTATWESTTLILVAARAGGRTGIGYTYGSPATAELIRDVLAAVVLGCDAQAPSAVWRSMSRAVRNAGRPGIGAMAISAVDIALWDLAARLRDLPLFRALPCFHDQVEVYGSGGFTNYPLARLADQLGGWAERGIPRVKMKTSRDPAADPERLDVIRAAIGPDVELFVDANGALGRKQALYWSEMFADRWDVRWFEEPVSSDDCQGLRLLRDRGPAGLEIAAGEYGYVLRDFVDLLDAGAVDCLQADVTRCCGITGLLQVAGLAAAHHIDLSAHCAPAVSAHAFCAVPGLRHLEYFHDHVRVESLAFDGTLDPVGGALRPDRARTGLGLEVRWADLEAFRVFGATAAA